MTTTISPLDPTRVEALAGELCGLYAGGMLASMLDVGYRTGLFTAAAEGPATSKGLAVRAGLEERDVREWLGAMAAARIFEYDAASGVYELPAEHAARLTGGGYPAPGDPLDGVSVAHKDA